MCPPWNETLAAALRSKSAQQLAEACQQVPPRQWWKAFAEAYPLGSRRPETEGSADGEGRAGSQGATRPEEARRH
jgi:hypothetical protein